MTPVVRKPVQAYLTLDERAELDRVARELGVSRSEALRRGLRAIRSAMPVGPLRDLVGDGLAAAALAPPGEPPPAAPVMPIARILAGLAVDRDDRWAASASPPPTTGRSMPSISAPFTSSTAPRA